MWQCHQVIIHRSSVDLSTLVLAHAGGVLLDQAFRLEIAWQLPHNPSAIHSRLDRLYLRMLADYAVSHWSSTGSHLRLESMALA